LYSIQPGNGSDLFLQLQGLHGTLHHLKVSKEVGFLRHTGIILAKPGAVYDASAGSATNNLCNKEE